MKQETLYKILIVILLVMNLALISSLFLTKKKPPRPRENGKPNAVEMLRLDNNQNIQFKEFGKQHREAMVSLQEAQKKCVRDYFLHPSDSLLNCIKEIETKKIKTTEKHFEDMRSVLNENQLEYYREFKRKALKYILR